MAKGIPQISSGCRVIYLPPGEGRQAETLWVRRLYYQNRVWYAELEDSRGKLQYRQTFIGDIWHLGQNHQHCHH